MFPRSRRTMELNCSRHYSFGTECDAKIHSDKKKKVKSVRYRARRTVYMRTPILFLARRFVRRNERTRTECVRACVRSKHENP